MKTAPVRVSDPELRRRVLEAVGWTGIGHNNSHGVPPGGGNRQLLPPVDTENGESERLFVRQLVQRGFRAEIQFRYDGAAWIDVFDNGGARVGRAIGEICRARAEAILNIVALEKIRLSNQAPVVVPTGQSSEGPIREHLVVSMQEIAAAENPAGMLDAAIATAGLINDGLTAGDTEWSEPQWIHLHTVVTAFAVGVLTAHCWYVRYQLPANFEAVLNAWSLFVWERLAEQATAREVIQLSLLTYEAMVREFIELTPDCKAWNDLPGSQFISSGTPIAESASFIDLGAMTRNGAVFIRDERRRDNAFDLKHGFNDVKEGE